MIRYILALISGIIILITALPLIREDEWFIRIFDFPRLQIAAIALIVIIIFPFAMKTKLWEIILYSALVLSVGYQTYMIYPYTVLKSKEVLDASIYPNDRTISIISANVLMTNRNSDGLLNILKREQPDIILIVEPDEWWERKLRVLEEDYPTAIKKPLENTYGMLLYSKLELIDPKIRYLIEEKIPSISSKVKLRSGDIIRLDCQHPKPPRPDKNQDTVERDAELMVIGREIEKDGQPSVIIGDLNDVAWSHTTKLFQKISSLLDPRKGRGFYNTFPAKYPLLGFALDHAFHSEHFTLIDFRKLEKYGSDHLPIFIRLAYDPDAVQQQDEPSAGEEARNRAREKKKRLKTEGLD